jgi:hypothetical protein
MKTTRNKTMNRVFIHLGTKEYGNQIMETVARETFAAYTTADKVTIYEHGGWWLSYRRDMQVVGTANDCAVFSDDIKDWWRQWPRGTDYVNLADIRRP